MNTWEIVKQVLQDIFFGAGGFAGFCGGVIAFIRHWNHPERLKRKENRKKIKEQKKASKEQLRKQIIQLKLKNNNSVHKNINETIGADTYKNQINMLENN